MSSLNLSAVMDAIAAQLVAAGTTKTAYAWPAENPSIPCAVVGYPEGEITIGITMQRGGDHAEIPIWFLLGKVADQSARDLLSNFLEAGAAGVSEALSGNLGGACQDTDLAKATIETVVIGGVQYLTCKFVLDVLA